MDGNIVIVAPEASSAWASLREAPLPGRDEERRRKDAMRRVDRACHQSIDRVYTSCTWNSDNVHIVIAHTRIACWIFSNQTQIGTFNNAKTTHGLHVCLAIFDANVGPAHERA